jgi:hypothetical protein
LGEKRELSSPRLVKNKCIDDTEAGIYQPLWGIVAKTADLIAFSPRAIARCNEPIPLAKYAFWPGRSWNRPIPAPLGSHVGFKVFRARNLGAEGKWSQRLIHLNKKSGNGGFRYQIGPLCA